MTQTKAPLTAGQRAAELAWLKLATPPYRRIEPDEFYYYAHRQPGMTAASNGYRLHVVKRDDLWEDSESVGDTFGGDFRPVYNLYSAKHRWHSNAPDRRFPSLDAMAYIGEVKAKMYVERQHLLDGLAQVETMATFKRDPLVGCIVFELRPATNEFEITWVVLEGITRRIFAGSIPVVTENGIWPNLYGVVVGWQLADALIGFTTEYVTITFGSDRIIIEDDERYAVIMTRGGPVMTGPLPENSEAEMLRLDYTTITAMGALNTGAPLYKVLQGDMSAHGGKHIRWSLPTINSDGTFTPGGWHRTTSRVDICHAGFHLTTRPWDRWALTNMRVYLAEGAGPRDTDGDDKIAFQRARLLRPADPPDWFVALQDSIRYFTSPEGIMFGLNKLSAESVLRSPWLVVVGPTWADAYQGAVDALEQSPMVLSPEPGSKALRAVLTSLKTEMFARDGRDLRSEEPHLQPLHRMVVDTIMRGIFDRFTDFRISKDMRTRAASKGNRYRRREGISEILAAYALRTTYLLYAGADVDLTTISDAAGLIQAGYEVMYDAVGNCVFYGSNGPAE